MVKAGAELFIVETWHQTEVTLTNIRHACRAVKETATKTMIAETKGKMAARTAIDEAAEEMPAEKHS